MSPFRKFFIFYIVLCAKVCYTYLDVTPKYFRKEPP
nr:MAG TPA: hypothetical protein [Caudoviricetes sp.]